MANALKTAPRRVRRARAESLITTLMIAILGLTVLACAGMLAPILWTALSESTRPTARACDSLKSATERSACLETQGIRANPAASTTAPLDIRNPPAR
jgi:hypothetical protein